MTVVTLTPLVFPAMGTMISLRTTQPVSDEVTERIIATFAAWEARFSRHRADSEITAINTGRLPRHAISSEFRRTRDRAVHWRVRTGGAFTPTAPDGTLDLNGIVKALAIHAAGVELTAAGLADWCLNAGGDVLVSGQEAERSPWVVGIADPSDRAGILAAVPVSGSRSALATSGYAERGSHVWHADPADSSVDVSPIQFTQVSVLADDIVTADVLATAILAGGPATLAQMETLYDIDVLAVGPDGLCWAAEAFRD